MVLNQRCQVVSAQLKLQFSAIVGGRRPEVSKCSGVAHLRVSECPHCAVAGGGGHHGISSLIRRGIRRCRHKPSLPTWRCCCSGEVVTTRAPTKVLGGSLQRSNGDEKRHGQEMQGSWRQNERRRRREPNTTGRGEKPTAEGESRVTVTAERPSSALLQ